MKLPGTSVCGRERVSRETQRNVKGLARGAENNNRASGPVPRGIAGNMPHKTPVSYVLQRRERLYQCLTCAHMDGW